MNILKFFRKKKKEAFVPTKQYLIDLPKSFDVFFSAQNKELTDTKPFSDLLSYFQHFPFKEENVHQSINTEISSFRKNIFETSSCMSAVVRGVLGDDTNVKNLLWRLGMDRQMSYLFFTEKPSENYSYIDQAGIDQMVNWMKSILDYFEQNKVSMDEKHEEICSAIHTKLNLFYDFYYYLLCHMANVRCDHLNSVALTKTIDF